MKTGSRNDLHATGPRDDDAVALVAAIDWCKTFHSACQLITRTQQGKGVADEIHEIVRAIKFDGWQSTHAGEREIRKAARQMLLKFKLHNDGKLIEKACGRIMEYC